MRFSLLIVLQVSAVLAVAVLAYGLTFLLVASSAVAPNASGPAAIDAAWPVRAATGIAAAAVVYFGAIRSQPRPWLPEPAPEERDASAPPVVEQ